MADFDEKDFNERDEEKKEIQDVNTDGEKRAIMKMCVLSAAGRKAKQGKCLSSPIILPCAMTVCIRPWIP